MTETKKRIHALKKRLPSVKARVAATALSLLLAVAMMTSVSFAWFSLSASPELGGVKTLISSNGNLEVALSDYDGLAPDRSGIGDSFSADGQSVHAANTSWGNLINLSGNYGIENLILRPAKLDASYPALLTGVKYSSDGRYEATATDFGFTSWALDEVTNQYNFLVPHGDAFGVRAISSVGYKSGQGKDPLQIALDNAKAKNAQARTEYELLMKKGDGTTKGDKNLAVVSTLVTAFANEKLSAGSSASFNENLDDIYNMLEDFYLAICLYGDALTDLAKIQQKAYCEKNGIAYTPFTRETLMAASNTVLQQNGVSLSTLSSFKSIESKTKADMEKVEAYKQQALTTDITWTHMQPIIDNLIDIDTVTIDGERLMGMGKGEMAGMAMGGGTKIVKVKSGNMHTFEKISGARMNANGPVDVSVKALGITLVGRLSTDLEDAAPLYDTDEATTKSRAEISDFKGAMVAEDTYGMILDLWVRTNAANSYLTLDGLLDLEIYYTQHQGKVLSNGELITVLLWKYTYYTGEKMEVGGQELMETAEKIVYVIPQSLDPENPDRTPKQYDIQVQVGEMEYKTVKISEGVFYDYATDEQVYRIDENGNPITTGQTDENGNPVYVLIDHTDVVAHVEKHDKVLGFQGSNRVDDDYGAGLPVGEISATQGSGSCYIFYADTPEAATEAKELLKNLKFAFLNANNTIMARAEMDVEHMLEQGGKYVVPLRVVTDTYEVEGVNCIMPLEQNVATRVSVLVYLDGSALENSMVMSKDSILGSLNIQFSSAARKEPMGNTDLEIQTITLSAAITNDHFVYDGQPKSAELKANIGGITPNTVLAYFQRQVNASQGSRLDPVVLTERSDATGNYWGADPQFLTPGTYVLRTLVIDGVEYDLPEPIVVTVEGLQVTYVSFNESMALTADRYVDRDIELAIQADANTRPNKVQVRFRDDDEQYTAGTLTFDPNSISAANPYGLWKGTVRFNSSSTYTLEFVVMDGEYNEVPATMQKSFTAYMGLRTRVYLIREGGLTFKFRGPENIQVFVDILSDSDEAMKNLNNVNLYYARRGSTSLADELHAEMLKWENGHYVGLLPVDEIGTFVFSRLTVGDNMITVAESAPTITAQPTDPPSYEGSGLFKDNADVTLDPSKPILVLNDKNPIFVKVQTKNATTAYKAILTLTDAFGAKQEVVIYEGVGEDGLSYMEDNVYYFAIPNTMAGNRNGKWTVTGMKLYGVYDAAGNYYDAPDSENPNRAPFGLSFTNEVTLIDEFSVSLPTSTDVLGKDATGKVTAAFMQDQKLTKPLQVSISFSGFTNLPAGVSIKDVTLTLYHNPDSSKTFGGYTYVSDANGDGINDNPNATKVCELTKSGDYYVTDSNVTLNLAGTYYGVVTFGVEGASLETIYFTKEFKTAKLVEVNTAAPTVNITAAVYANKDKDDKVTISNSKAVSVYFRESKNTNCGITTTNYKSPEVSITLAGYGSASGAKMTFSNTAGGDVHLYKTGGSGKSNSDQTTDFEWTGNGAVKRYVGKYVYKSGASDEKAAAGTLTASELQMTFGGMAYTFSVPTITISNPS